MTYRIVIKCHNCEYRIRNELGTPGFLGPWQTEFTTFSDAHTHIMENPEHYMSMEIIEDDEHE